MKALILENDCASSVIDVGISRFESAEFMRLRISARVDKR
jgi:hypothetical protein